MGRPFKCSKCGFTLLGCICRNEELVFDKAVIEAIKDKKEGELLTISYPEPGIDGPIVIIEKGGGVEKRFPPGKSMILQVCKKCKCDPCRCYVV